MITPEEYLKDNGFDLQQVESEHWMGYPFTYWMSKYAKYFQEKQAEWLKAQPDTKSFELVKFVVHMDELGDRSSTVAVSKDKEKLEDYCLETYDVPTGKDKVNMYNDYYLIVETDLQIV